MKDASNKFKALHVTRKQRPITVEDIEDLQADLDSMAQSMVDDYEETRDNLSEKEGLLATWEDNYGYQSDSWENVMSDISAIDPVGDTEAGTEVDELFDELESIWNGGEY